MSIGLGVTWNVSMPFNGLTSFLPTLEATYTPEDVCQCPSTGLHHFYGNCTDQCFLQHSVSMPFNGLTSFLPYNLVGLPMEVLMCQCPSTGLHHFYAPHARDLYGAFVGVNALQRAYIISTLPFWKPLFIRL